MVIQKVREITVDVRMDKITARLLQLLLSGHDLEVCVAAVNKQFGENFPVMNEVTAKATLRQIAFALIPAVGGVDKVCLEDPEPVIVMAMPDTIH